MSDGSGDEELGLRSPWLGSTGPTDDGARRREIRRRTLLVAAVALGLAVPVLLVGARLLPTSGPLRYAYLPHDWIYLPFVVGPFQHFHPWSVIVVLWGALLGAVALLGYLRKQSLFHVLHVEATRRFLHRAEIRSPLLAWTGRAKARGLRCAQLEAIARFEEEGLRAALAREVDENRPPAPHGLERLTELGALSGELARQEPRSLEELIERVRTLHRSLLWLQRREEHGEPRGEEHVDSSEDPLRRLAERLRALADEALALASGHPDEAFAPRHLLAQIVALADPALPLEEKAQQARRGLRERRLLLASVQQRLGRATEEELASAEAIEAIGAGLPTRPAFLHLAIGLDLDAAARLGRPELLLDSFEEIEGLRFCTELAGARPRWVTVLEGAPAAEDRLYGSGLLADGAARSRAHLEGPLPRGLSLFDEEDLERLTERDALERLAAGDPALRRRRGGS